jgi:hypothetical protein
VKLKLVISFPASEHAQQLPWKQFKEESCNAPIWLNAIRADAIQW